MGYVLLAAVVLGFGALALYQRISPRVIGWVERITDRAFIPKRIQAIFLSILEKLSDALSILKDWREMLLVSFWSCMLWLSISVPTW